MDREKKYSQENFCGKKLADIVFDRTAVPDVRG